MIPYTPLLSTALLSFLADSISACSRLGRGVSVVMEAFSPGRAPAVQRGLAPRCLGKDRTGPKAMTSADEHELEEQLLQGGLRVSENSRSVPFTS